MLSGTRLWPCQENDVGNFIVYLSTTPLIACRKGLLVNLFRARAPTVKHSYAFGQLL